MTGPATDPPSARPTPARARSSFGRALRGWREHRGLSQLELSFESGVSPRHLSFLETGRSRPSQEMVLKLLDSMDVPLWDRNRVLLAAGYAPVYAETPLDDQRLVQVRRAVRLLLDRHQPYPAYAMDGAWNLVDANQAFRTALPPLDRVEPGIAGNVLHLLCGPDLLRPAILNWEPVVRAVLRRVRRQLDAPEPPPRLAEVVAAIRDYPGVEALFAGAAAPQPADAFLPVSVRTGDGTQHWLTILMTVGGALDVTVDQLVVECFFPADEPA